MKGRKKECWMEFYCTKCGGRFEYRKKLLPAKCPKCRDSMHLFFEKDGSWNIFCWTWAYANGMPYVQFKDAVHYSLPKWLVMEDRLKEWEKFKANLESPKLIDPSYSGLCVSTRDEVFEFWLYKTGLIDTWLKGFEPFYFFYNFPIVISEAKRQFSAHRKTQDLFNAYLNYWIENGGLRIKEEKGQIADEQPK